MIRSLTLLCTVALILAVGADRAGAQDPIPNGGFETWLSGEPVDWSTSYLAFPSSITQTADAHSGSWAVHGDVVLLFGSFWGPPWLQSPGYPDFPVSQRWGSLKGFYKLNSVGSDAIVVNVILFRAGFPMGVGSFVDSISTPTYTEFVAPIFYYDGTVPDSAFIEITMSPGEESPSFHQGSWYRLDDLVFSPDSLFGGECPIAVSGDANEDGEVKSSDIIYLVNYVLKAGPAPLPCDAAGDANGDGEVKSSDIIYVVNYVLKAGPAPEDICALIPSVWSCP